MCIFTGLVSLSLISGISVLSIIKQRIILAAVFRALAIIMTIVTSIIICIISFHIRIFIKFIVSVLYFGGINNLLFSLIFPEKNTNVYLLKMMLMLMRFLYFIVGLMIVVGALLYNYQKVKMFSFNARNPASSYPVEEEVVSYGFLLSVVSSVLLAVSAVLEISHLVIADTRRPLPPRIQPSDDNVKEKIDDTT